MTNENLNPPPLSDDELLDNTAKIASNASNAELLRQWKNTRDTYYQLHSVGMQTEADLWARAAAIHEAEILRRMGG